MADIDLAGLLQKFTTDYATAQADQQNRYNTGVIDLKKAIQAYQPGGGATAGLLQAGMAPVEQNMTSRGLMGTTRPGAVRAGMASEIEAQRMQGLAGAKTELAGYDVPQIIPTADTIAGLATGGFNALLSREIMEAELAPKQAGLQVDAYSQMAATYGSSGTTTPGGGTGVAADTGYENNLYSTLMAATSQSGAGF